MVRSSKVLQADSHKMVHVKDHPTGEEEWYCPQCGRRFLMHWPPEYKRTILESGDENATHVKSVMGLNLEMGKSQIQSYGKSTTANADMDDEIYLAPWAKWVDEIDFESMWND
jgi:hypothetical protein